MFTNLQIVDEPLSSVYWSPGWENGIDGLSYEGRTLLILNSVSIPLLRVSIYLVIN